MKKPKPVTGWSIVNARGKLTMLVCRGKTEAWNHAGQGEWVVKVRVLPIPARRKR